MLRKSVIIFLGLGVVLLISGCIQEKNYTNPVFEPVLADPTVIKADDGSFYAYGTEDAWGEETDTKLIPIVRSQNLTDWEYVGEAFEQKPDWKQTGGLWAPDITKINNQYYLYYSYSVWGTPIRELV
ncbi:family 43 glycosylhydrolase [Halobacillus amylolyticus]|uniref:family 43 glycosylhydrolase n=1 Tax=Halobacillus amylolyticus TaxID=2932259 RepID=UPI0037C12CCE